MPELSKSFETSKSIDINSAVRNTAIASGIQFVQKGSLPSMAKSSTFFVGEVLGDVVQKQFDLSFVPEIAPQILSTRKLAGQALGAWGANQLLKAGLNPNQIIMNSAMTQVVDNIVVKQWFKK